MKKLIALLLALVMVMALAACNATDEKKQEKGDSPLEILEKVWDSYSEDEKFPVSGGDMQTHMDQMEANENYEIPNAPGIYNMEQKEELPYIFYISEENVAKVEEAATMVHMMNGNNFTCGTFRLTDSKDVDGFVKSAKESIMGNQWMCGQPDQLIIATFGSDVVMIAFGINDAIDPFMEKLTAAYPDAELVVQESLV